MKVYIEQTVHNQVEQFYEEALLKHSALDELTIIKKIQRLYDALEALGDYAYIYPLARLKDDWIKKGYREYICEDFHFAYQIYIMDDGERIVRIHDAVHSLLYF